MTVRARLIRRCFVAVNRNDKLPCDLTDADMRTVRDCFVPDFGVNGRQVLVSDPINYDVGYFLCHYGYDALHSFSFQATSTNAQFNITRFWLRLGLLL
jgi:hypothetical protein